MAVYESVLQPRVLLSPDEIEARYKAAARELMRVAMQDLRLADERQIYLRDLLPSDLGETNEVWAEQTSGTANAYESSLIASQSIANERFVAILGLNDTSSVQAVSVVRFTVGNSRVAQWSLFNLLSEDTSLRARMAFARSPVIIRQNQELTIAHYVRQALGSVEIAYIGLVAEKRGRILEA